MENRTEERGGVVLRVLRSGSREQAWQENVWVRWGVISGWGEAGGGGGGVAGCRSEQEQEKQV